MVIFFKNKISCFIPSILMIFLSGCGVTEKTKISTCLKSFKNLISMDIGYKAVSWEFFGTPEHTGGVPGPTDFLTLVAEIEALQDKIPPHNDLSDFVWIAPESARPWLEPQFRRLLETSENSLINVSKNKKCQPISALLSQNNKAVYGFACEGDKRMLIYLRLANFT